MHMETGLTVSGCREYTNTARHRAVERVIVWMRENLGEPLSLREMAKISYISPFHFNRVFRQVTGIPPIQFLYALRIEAAKRILLTTTLSVTDVCYFVGYNSLGTFTTRFTQRVGLSPCHFRKLAEQFKTFPVETLCDQSLQLQPKLSGSSVRGRVNAPDEAKRAIFVGLFPAHIPQSRPVAGTLVAGPGHYQIDSVPDGNYHLLAAAFPLSHNPLDYLLPEEATLLVAAGQNPISAERGWVSGQTGMMLRPLQMTDPPILIALPSLFSERLRGLSKAGNAAN
jgi:AraC family transcriptional regulator